MFPLSELRLVGIAIAVAAVLALIAAAVHHERQVGAQKAELAQARAVATETAIAQKETERRVAADSENLDEFHRLQARNIADGVAVDRSAADAIRLLHGTSGSRPASNPQATAGGETCRPVPGTACVSEGMLADLIEHDRQASKYADCLASAGQLCADDYSALTPP